MANSTHKGGEVGICGSRQANAESSARGGTDWQDKYFEDHSVQMHLHAAGNVGETQLQMASSMSLMSTGIQDQSSRFASVSLFESKKF